jgi:hypothetical protein
MMTFAYRALPQVAASFNTAVLEKEHWIIYRPRLAQIYLSGWHATAIRPQGLAATICAAT